VDASDELDSCFFSQRSKAPDSYEAVSRAQETMEIDEVESDFSTQRKRCHTGVTAYNHRKAWSDNPLKVRCRPSKYWRKQRLGQDDSLLHLHTAEPLVRINTRCVLCCRLCYNPEGKFYIRDTSHLHSAEDDEMNKPDLVRKISMYTLYMFEVHVIHKP
jgi:hypothetical protein